METYISYDRLVDIANNINSNTRFGDINIHKHESGTKFNKNSKSCDVYLLEIKGTIVGQIRKCPLIGTVEYRLSYKNIPTSGCFNPTKRNRNIFEKYNYYYLPWLDINTRQQEKITYKEIEQNFPPEPISNNDEFDENKTIKYSVLEDIGNELIKFINKQPENVNKKAAEHNLGIYVANSFYNHNRGKFSKFNIKTIINYKEILIGYFIIHNIRSKKLPQLYVKLLNNYSIHFDKTVSPNIEALSGEVQAVSEVPEVPEVPAAKTLSESAAPQVLESFLPVSSEEKSSLLPKKTVWGRLKGMFSVKKKKGGKHNKKTMRNLKNKCTKKQRK